MCQDTWDKLLEAYAEDNPQQTSLESVFDVCMVLEIDELSKPITYCSYGELNPSKTGRLY